VNNENLNGDFFEQHTGDPNITMLMFDQIHAVDPAAKLFLNDYNVISNTDLTVVRTAHTYLLFFCLRPA